ncbi:helix-turn-helix domain-containing protein [Sporolactobacillus terrae]|uniref:helix-turn-helix domain-containing protein n=1 Tax=Sporolactobacillus terrae TaxID=269673 RepID=UPI000490B08F|nr:helix-turn-helix transcriptional regulator [Sporolactobacillus terrae]
MKLNDRIKKIRKDNHLTQSEFGKKLHVSPQVVSNWERAYTIPGGTDLENIAKIFSVNPIEFNTVNESETPYYSLNKKDEKDIAKDMENLVSELNGDSALAFDGEPMDEETKRLVAQAIESNLRMAKQIAKKKFTPKKYRNRE